MWQNVALKPRFALVTFDVTNTLLQFQSSVGIQYARIASSYGIRCDPKKLDAAFKFHWKLLRREHPNFGRHTGLTSQKWWKEIVSQSFSHIQPQISFRQLAAISDELYKVYATEQCWKLDCHVTEQLKSLQEHSVILGVISNFDERLHSVLVSTGLRPFFNFVLSSYEEGVEKPDKKIFDLALSKVSSMGIQASEAVHIGDDFQLDYLAAKNAGWNAFLLKQTSDSDISELCSKSTTITTKEFANYLLKPI